MTQRPCLHRNPDGTGCPNYTQGSWCPEHQREHDAEKQRSDPRKTHQWRKLRADILAAFDHRCSKCGRHADDLPPGQHIELSHRNGNPQDGRPENLEPLCPLHHREHHAALRRGRGKRQSDLFPWQRDDA